MTVAQAGAKGGRASHGGGRKPRAIGVAPEIVAAEKARGPSKRRSVAVRQQVAAVGKPTPRKPIPNMWDESPQDKRAREAREYLAAHPKPKAAPKPRTPRKPRTPSVARQVAVIDRRARRTNENPADEIAELQALARKGARSAPKPKGVRLKSGAYAKRRTKEETNLVYAAAQARKLQLAAQRTFAQIDREAQVALTRAEAHPDVNTRRAAIYRWQDIYGEADSNKRANLVKMRLRSKGYRV